MDKELVVKNAMGGMSDFTPAKVINTALEFQQLLMLYESGIKQITTKFEILEDEFESKHQRNPISTISSRIKDPLSIAEKLQRKGLDLTIDNMVNRLHDIAGIRVTCPFVSDVYHVMQMLLNQEDIKLIKMKDYIKEPKSNGYRSLHVIVKVGVYFSDQKREIPVEIQIRTIAMDFWASLEHKIYYKFEGHAPEYISHDLQECSKIVSELDERMLQLNEAIQKTKAEQEEEQKEPPA